MIHGFNFDAFFFGGLVSYNNHCFGLENTPRQKNTLLGLKNGRFFFESNVCWIFLSQVPAKKGTGKKVQGELPWVLVTFI